MIRVPRSVALAFGCALTLCLVSRAGAKPPESPRFARAKELLEKLEARSERLRQEEEFKAKPREERLVLKFKEGAEKFEGEELTGAFVIREVMEWDRVRRKIPSDDVKRVLLLLPEAFKARYGFVYTKSKALRKQRRSASARFIAALNHDFRHVRKMAIDCLAAMYGVRRGYKVDASESERRKKQKEWRRAVLRNHS
jgi:hypothetical protein